MVQYLTKNHVNFCHDDKRKYRHKNKAKCSSLCEYVEMTLNRESRVVLQLNAFSDRQRITSFTPSRDVLDLHVPVQSFGIHQTLPRV